MYLARRFVAALALLMLPSAGHAQDQGPSYSCSTAELEAELTVCNSRRLSRLDRQVDQLYRDVRDAARTGRERRRLRREQFDWLSERNSCERNRRCLRRRYEERVNVLEALVGDRNDNDDYADNSGEGPSFSCRNVEEPAERRICRSDRLSRMDRDMAALFVDVRQSVSRWRTRRKLVREQKAWIRDRNDCGRDRRCIRSAYETRIAELREYKRKLRPAYQRTAGWRVNCIRPRHRTIAATCASETLWSQYIDLSRVYQVALRSTGPRGKRRIERDQAQWAKDWQSCGQRQQCQSRKIRRRIAQLQDPSYVRERRRPAYQRDDGWEQSCLGNVRLELRVTCDSERLWSYYLEMSRAYQAALRLDGRTQRRVKRDQVRWNKEWASCRRNERCHARAFRTRIAELKDVYADGSAGGLDFQRTAEWRRICPRVQTTAGRTTCNSEELWLLNVEMRRVYDSTVAWAKGYGARRFVENDQAAWKRSWESCGANVRCQRRAYRGRIVQLEDDSYRVTQRRRSRRQTNDDDGYGSGVGYRNTSHWRSYCSNTPSPARRATCDSAELWRLHGDVIEAYNDAIRAAGGASGGLAQDNARWSAAWNACGANVRCQRRSYRQRIRQLRDPNYLSKFGSVRTGGDVVRNRDKFHTEGANK